MNSAALLRYPRSYMKIAGSLLVQIDDGTYKSGDQLPSLGELAEQFTVSRSTAGHAMRVLAGAELLHFVPGLGYFVCEQTKEALELWGVDERQGRRGSQHQRGHGRPGQRLAEIICAFCADALSSTVNLNVDLDVMLAVLACAFTAAPRTRLPGYAAATPDTIQRRFLTYRD